MVKCVYVGWGGGLFMLWPETALSLYAGIQGRVLYTASAGWK